MNVFTLNSTDAEFDNKIRVLHEWLQMNVGYVQKTIQIFCFDSHEWSVAEESYQKLMNKKLESTSITITYGKGWAVILELHYKRMNGGRQAFLEFHTCIDDDVLAVQSKLLFS